MHFGQKAPRACWARWLVFACLLGPLGCGKEEVTFPANQIYSLCLEQETGSDMVSIGQDVDAVLTRLFGTPDQAIVPKAMDGLVNSEQVLRAAGPWASDQEGLHRGLYREHCAICHGTDGGGKGPTAAFQKPYPRDYRMGIYKFKSTPRGEKPTREDLYKTLRNGIPGTAMPAFALLSRQDAEAVIDYTIYLSVRGELERRLLAVAAREFEYGHPSPEPAERLFALELEDSDPAAFGRQWDFINEQLQQIVQTWEEAPSAVEPVPPVPSWVFPTPSGSCSKRSEWSQETVASIKRGEALFHGQVANCVGCHGPNGDGQVVTLDFDDWTKDWTTRAGITPSDREAIKPFRNLGALRPRKSEARALQQGILRGGAEPAALFRRIVCGIDGTPMPAAKRREHPGGVGLGDNDIWDLVNYVLSFPDWKAKVDKTDVAGAI